MADLQNTTQQQTLTEASGHVQMIIEDSIEYKVLQAYAERKKPRHTHLSQSNGPAEAPVPSEKHHKRGKRRRIKLTKFLRCIRPVKEDDVPESEDNRFRPSPASAGSDQEVEGIVNQLTKITDSVHFYPPDLQCDSSDSDSKSSDNINRMVEILREHGDVLDEKIKKDQKLMQELQRCLSYNFYRNIADAFLSRLSPEEVPPAENPDKTRLALICEITSRMKTMDRHPMNRVLGFGAIYIQGKLTPWVAKQGDYGEVFSRGDDAEEEVQ